jgi:insertion element IS1 protein InsB
VIQLDELWRFVGSKVHVQWVWVAWDGATRRVLGMVVGDRSTATARRLWAALPVDYRTDATVYTDHLASYRKAVPKAQHRAVGKDSGRTAHIERFWLTLRQRCSRLVRKALSFSKCIRNHVGAIWYFVRHYNQCRR